MPSRRDQINMSDEELRTFIAERKVMQCATLGQRVYASRRRANLTIAETAQAAGVSEDDIARAEADSFVAQYPASPFVERVRHACAR